MKKVIVVLIIAIIGVSALTYMVWKGLSQVDFKKLTGTIYMTSPNREGIFISTSDVVAFNPSKKVFSNTSYSCDSPYVNDEKTKLLGNFVDKIVEYNIGDSTYREIYKVGRMVTVESPKYVPGRDAVSFLRFSDLIIYDLSKNDIKVIKKISKHYSWTKDGKHLYYGSDLGISRMDIETNTSELVVSGKVIRPTLSYDNKLLAYQKPKDESENIFTYDLVVRDLESGQEWKRNTSNAITSYTFSPDGNYIAYMRQGGEFPYFFKTQRMSVWDFKSNKESTLIKDVGRAANSNFDWK